MAKLTINDISAALRKLDICMMTTTNSEGMLESRPMSNNKDVDYAGDSYFFTLDKTSAVRDLKSKPQVCLAYEGRRNMLAAPIYLCVSGVAELIKDRAQLEKHWAKDLEIWFDKGIDTPGLTLIHVTAHHIKYWDGMDEGEVTLPAIHKQRAM